MKDTIIIARVYITEEDKVLNSLMDYLHNQLKVKGVTLFRAISGFGKSGALHSSTILSMSLDLPLVLEFFDVPEKVQPALEHITSLVGEGHVVSWEATGN
jgi:PII-like signaling protein